MHKTAAASRFGLGRSAEEGPEIPERRHGIFVFAEHRDQLPAIRKVILQRLSDASIMVPELEAVAPKVRGAGASAPKGQKHPKWPGGEKWGDLVTPRGRSWWFSASDVEKDSESLYLFGENDAEKKNVPAHRVGSTQATIRGLPNAIGIRTCYGRGRGYRDDTYAQNVENMRADFAEALTVYSRDPSLKWVVFPGDGIGTGKAKLNTEARAAKTFAEFLKIQSEFVKRVRKVAAEKQAAAAGPDRSMSLLRGGVAAEELGKARRAKSHIVLTTYGYSRRGISLPDMTALVMASPRRNGGIQLVGRIKRRGSDQRIKRVIVDIVDVCTGLKSQSTDRNKAYKESEFPIYTTRISHDKVRMPTIAEEPSVATEIPKDDEIDAIIEGLVEAECEPEREPDPTDEIGIDDLYVS